MKSFSSAIAMCASVFVLSSCCYGRCDNCCDPRYCYAEIPKCCTKQHWWNPDEIDPTFYTAN